MANMIKTRQKPQATSTAKAKTTNQATRVNANPQQIHEAPQSLRPEELRAAQQQFGNQAVQRAVEDPGQPDSITDPQGYLREDLSNSIQQARGAGSPLPQDVQTTSSRQLGHSFANVRIHTDEHADQLSSNLNARAFTIGSDIFFRRGVFAPSTQRGRETLLHELTHVVQQSGSPAPSGRLKLGQRGTALEKQAEQNGRGASSAVAGHTSGAVQKEEGTVQRVKDAEEWDTGDGAKDEEESSVPHSDIQSHLSKLLTGQSTGSQGSQAPSTEPDQSTMSPDELLKSKMQKRRALIQPDEAEDSGTSESGTHESGGIPDAPPPPPMLSQTAPSAPSGKKKTPSFSEQIKSKAGQISPSLTKTGRLKQFFGMSVVAPDKKDALSSERTSSSTDKSDHRGKLLAAIENPSSSTEQVEEAKSKYKLLFGDQKDSLEKAVSNRKNNLLKKAQSGDADALERHKAENTKMGRLKGFFTGLAGKAKGLYDQNKGTIDKAMPYIKEYAPKALGAIGGLFGGGKKADAGGGGGGGGGVTINAGGGGGGGGAGVAGMIAELYTENKQLKEKIAELEKGKTQ